jgi:hypothetical protein
MEQNRPCSSPKISPYMISINLTPMSWLLQANWVNRLMLRLIQTQIAVLCLSGNRRPETAPKELAKKTGPFSFACGPDIRLSPVLRMPRSRPVLALLRVSSGLLWFSFAAWNSLDINVHLDNCLNEDGDGFELLDEDLRVSLDPSVEMKMEQLRAYLLHAGNTIFHRGWIGEKAISTNTYNPSSSLFVTFHCCKQI